jgi:tRNA-splicing ligase RtcB (3'-phosphate/5'-hydroxy nucleic acid ligase)
MKPKALTRLGVPRGEAMDIAVDIVNKAAEIGLMEREIKHTLTDLFREPKDFASDQIFGALARHLLSLEKAQAGFKGREKSAPYKAWGSDFEQTAVQQMENACMLPISVAGALMPDAHQGYGLPIGGVLAVKNAVIPYAVGVDIACRMKMTVLDMPVSALDDNREQLKTAIKQEARFGVGATFKNHRQHGVMDEDWNFSRVTAHLKSKAWSQLGTSGSGNHFVEFGTLTLEKNELGLKAGVYLALLSHSGSRGTGNEIASHYSKVAKRKHPELPRELGHLSWLDLSSEEGQEYWQAMELMGRYAAANHELIHRHIAANLGVQVLVDIENHHNYAWKENHGGEDLIVHRKGATPAEKGVLGIIPGSMATPGYVVRGKGEPLSLNSAAHGAGRKMSRTVAKKTFRWDDVNKFLAERKVELMSAGLDEFPLAYKDIEEVMSAQGDLVERVARFDPKLVKMAQAGERPED